MLNIPDHLRVLALVAVGYPAEEGSSNRKDLDKLVHYEKY
jgi:nitroreductase